jgi:hypothetical protein
VDWIGNEDCANSRAADSYYLRWLEQHQEMALFHQESADYSGKDDDDSYDPKHCCSLMRVPYLSHSGFLVESALLGQFILLDVHALFAITADVG